MIRTVSFRGCDMLEYTEQVAPARAVSVLPRHLFDIIDVSLFLAHTVNRDRFQPI